MPEQIPILRVFLSSPGDVNEERKIALDVIERLPYRPAFRERVAFRVVAWDKIGADTPLRATLTPQEAINQGLPMPSACDIVVVIFWSRMGTAFSYQGREYLSGTHFELLDAVQSQRAQTVIYRRDDIPPFDVTDPDFEHKHAQYLKVGAFFGSELFYDATGKIVRGINKYKTPDDFREIFETHFEALVVDSLSRVEADTRALSHEQDNQAAENVFAVELVEWPPDKSPFPGLRAFTENDASIFFGRGREIDALVKQVANSRFVAVVGASGSGKSSLVAAGLIPRLRANAISSESTGSKDWHIVQFSPGSHPFESLAAALINNLSALAASTPRSYAKELDDFAISLQERPDRLTKTLDNVLKTDRNWVEVLLFIDQLEELFTLALPRERAAFIAMLAAAAEYERLRIVATIRADFYQRATAYQELAELLRGGSFTLAAPKRDALRQMIERPAERAGLTIEDGLIERILDDTGDEPGNLALIAFLLEEMYQASKSDHYLTLTAYQDLGGVQGGIGQRAEHVFSAIAGDSHEKEIVLQHIFQELVDVDDDGNATRRRFIYDVASHDDAVQAMVAALVDARLLTSGSGSLLEVAHEALLREWQRLSKWIQREQFMLRLRRTLHNDAQDWLQRGKPEDLLYRGSVLEEAQQFTAQHPQQAAVVNEFLTLSAQTQADRLAHEQLIARRVQNFRRVTAGLAIMVALAVVAVIAAIGQFDRAQSQLVTATVAQGDALNAQQTSAALEGQANTQVYLAGATLTPIPVTLNAVASQQADAQNTRVAIQADSYYYRMAGQASFLRADANNALPFAFEAIGKARPPSDVQQIFYETVGNSRYANIRTIIGDQAYITAVAFSPDGRFLASASCTKLTDTANGPGCEGGGLSLWVVNTGELQTSVTAHEGWITDIAFSPDGERLISASSDGTMILWNNMITELLMTISGHEGSVRDIAFSPDGHTLVYAVDSTIRFWDAVSGRQPASFSEPAQVNSVAFSPDGHTLTSGSYARISIWDLATGERRGILRVRSSVTGLVYSPDGRILASRNADNSVTLWDPVTGSQLRTLDAHSAWITVIKFSPDGEILVTGSEDTTAKLWDVDTGKQLTTITGHSGWVTDLAFSPDGETLVTGSRDTTIRFWAINDLQRVVILPGHRHGVASLTFSPDGQILASASCRDIVEDSCLEGEIKLWDTKTGVERQSLIGQHFVSQVVFSSDGNTLASSSLDQTIKLWDIVTGDEFATFSHNSGGVYGLAINPDGTTLASGGFDTSIYLWDIPGRKLRASLFGHKYAVNGIAFSPDGSLLASGSRDGTIKLWDAEAGSELTTLSGHTRDVTRVTFSPDGGMLASGSWDGTIRLWSVATGEEIMTLTGHAVVVSSVSFSPDGTMLASSSFDHTIRLWDVATGAQLMTLTNDDFSVPVVMFSPDGTRIASGSAAGNPEVDVNPIKLWTISSLPLMRQWTQDHRYVREFTCEERSRFNMRVQCDATGNFPTRTPYPAPSPIPLPTWTSIWTPLPPATMTPVPTLDFTPFYLDPT